MCVIQIYGNQITKIKSWQVEIGTQVNVIPLNTNLLCYNVVDKATSIMSRNIEVGTINYVSFYLIQAKFTK